MRLSYLYNGNPYTEKTSDPFHLHGLTLIPAWISNCIHYIVWDEITNPLLNFNGCNRMPG